MTWYWPRPYECPICHRKVMMWERLLHCHKGKALSPRSAEEVGERG